MCAAGKGDAAAISPIGDSLEQSATSIREQTVAEAATVDNAPYWYGCGWNNLVTSCAENFCAFQDLDEHLPSSHSGSSRERGFLDPHNFTIKHNDSMSTAATGDIDPEKIYREQMNLTEVLESFRHDRQRNAPADSSITSDDPGNESTSSPDADDDLRRIQPSDDALCNSIRASGLIAVSS